MSDFPEVEPLNCPGPIEQRRWQQLRFKIFGSWSRRVRDERVAEAYRCEAVTRDRLIRWQIEQLKRKVLDESDC